MSEQQDTPVPTKEEMDRVGLPAELRTRIAINPDALVLCNVAENGSLCFQLPDKREVDEQCHLNWHPDDPATWDNEGCRFYVVRDFYYKDPQGNSYPGQAIVLGGSGDPDSHDFANLIDWLDSN